MDACASTHRRRVPRDEIDSNLLEDDVAELPIEVIAPFARDGCQRRHSRTREEPGGILAALLGAADRDDEAARTRPVVGVLRSAERSVGSDELRR